MLSPPLTLGLLVGAGYLSGSLLGAIWVCRLMGLEDPRIAGSGNPGFSNVLRAHGWRPAALTLTIDAAKSVPVMWLADAASLTIWAQGLVGLSILVGHSVPVWHRGRGGKAVASAFGVLLMLATPVALVAALIWFVLAWRLRTAALASLAAALTAPLASYWLAPEATGVVCVFSLLVMLRHGWDIRHWRERRSRTLTPTLADPFDEEDALTDRHDLAAEAQAVDEPGTEGHLGSESSPAGHPEPARGEPPPRRR